MIKEIKEVSAGGRGISEGAFDQRRSDARYSIHPAVVFTILAGILSGPKVEFYAPAGWVVCTSLYSPSPTQLTLPTDLSTDGTSNHDYPLVAV